MEENYNISVATYNEDIRHNYLNDYIVMLKELFDNSLDWGKATKIKIKQTTNSFYIIDNGIGINTHRFKTILKHGEKNTNAKVNTIGKHGRGLNYASILLSNKTIIHTIRTPDDTETQCVNWEKMAETNTFKPNFNYDINDNDKRWLYKGETGTMIKLEILTTQFKKKLNEKKFRDDLKLNIKRLYYFSHSLNKKIKFEIQFDGDNNFILTQDDFKDVLCYDWISNKKKISYEKICEYEKLSEKKLEVFLLKNIFPLKLEHKFNFNKGSITIKATFLSEKMLNDDKERNKNKKKNYNGIYVQRISYINDDYITRDMVGPTPTGIFGFESAKQNTEDRARRLRIAIQFTSNLDKEFGITILKKFDPSREENIEEELLKQLNSKIKNIIDYQKKSIKKYREILIEKINNFFYEIKKNNINETLVISLQKEITLLGDVLPTQKHERYPDVVNFVIYEFFKKKKEEEIQKVKKTVENILTNIIDNVVKKMEEEEKEEEKKPKSEKSKPYWKIFDRAYSTFKTKYVNQELNDDQKKKLNEITKILKDF
jgi:hypothetical protein